MSIIIVGVGDVDFEDMEELDGDLVRLTASDGQVAERDIVQFVPFKNFAQLGLNSPETKLQLANEVLAEIPAQFLGYMKANGIKPRMIGRNCSKIRRGSKVIKVNF